MTVIADVTAWALGREDWEDYPAVLATPIMIAQMERACAKLLAALLEPGQLSVGVKVAIAHFNPSAPRSSRTPSSCIERTPSTGSRSGLRILPA